MILLDVLPPELADLYRNEGISIIEPIPPKMEDLQKIRLPKLGKEYPKVAARLLKAGMARLTVARPKVINSLFAVSKSDDADRLIADLRLANLYWSKPRPASLCNPADFASIRLGAGEKLFVGKGDVMNMFHNFRVPEWMQDWFGLPELNLEDIPDLAGLIEAGHVTGLREELGMEGKECHEDTVWAGKMFLRLTTLPMGSSHAVLLAHAAHCFICERSALREVPMVGSSSVELALQPGGDWEVRFNYIDDWGVLGICEIRIEELMEDSIKVLEEARLMTHKGKRVNSVVDVLEWPYIGTAISCLQPKVLTRSSE